MSCDFAVWNTKTKLTDKEAGKLYQQLCDGNTEGITESAVIGLLYKELTTKHPEIDDIEEDIDNTDLCPWSIKMDLSSGHLITSCVWSKSDYVYSLLKNLAQKYNLTFYDPQSGEVFYPIFS